MTTAQAEKKFSILAEIFEGKGVVSLQGQCRKVAKALPEMPFIDRLDHIKWTVPSVKGVDLESDLERKNIKCVTFFDEAYPDFLKEIADPPLALFYCGSLKALHRPCVSIIGARACTTYGIQTTRQIAGELAQIGFTVVSGLALGIDAVAHQSALEAEGLTASVLGSGVLEIYPKQHTRLARKIVRTGGAVLSEFPPNESPKPYHFPMRNRIISGLSHATIVIEAEKKSGTLITAQFCLDQDRELFAVPGPLNHSTSQGTHDLISRGEAHMFTSVNAFLGHFEGLISDAIEFEKKRSLKINDPIERAIYDSLDAFEPSCFDSLLADITGHFPITAGELGAKIAKLETQGLLISLSGQKYLRHPLGEKTE